MPQSHSPDLTPRLAPTWFFTKVGEVGNKMSPTFLHNDSAPTWIRHRYDSFRFSSTLPRFRLWHDPTCPDLATTCPDSSRLSADWYRSLSDLTTTHDDLTATCHDITIIVVSYLCQRWIWRRIQTVDFLMLFCMLNLYLFWVPLWTGNRRLALIGDTSG
jgi:hypothetical protein